MIKQLFIGFILFILYFLMLAVVVAFVQATVFYLFNTYFQLPANAVKPYERIATVLVVLATTYSTIVLISKKIVKNKLSDIHQTRKDLTELLEGGFENKLSLHLGANINELKRHYIIRQVQAQWSFRFSMVFICLGLVAILYVIVDGDVNKDYESIAGALSTFIGGTIFFMHQRMVTVTQKDMDQINQLNCVRFALEEVDKLTSKVKKDNERLKIIEKLTNLGIKTTPGSIIE